MAGIAFVVGLVAILLSFILAALVAHAQRWREQCRVIERLAVKLQGSLSSNRFTGSLRVDFQWQGRPAELDVQDGGNAENRFELCLPWTDQQFHCDIRPVGLGLRVAQWLGMPDIEIGDVDFDQQYDIQGSDATVVRRLLTADAQRLVESLRVRNMLGNVRISVRNGEWHVRRPYVHHRDIEPLISRSLQLYGVMTSQGDCITFTDADLAALQLTGGVCRVCGEVLRGDVVCCKRCLAPHHRECWDYCGQCSTYGCGETECSATGPNEA